MPAYDSVDLERFRAIVARRLGLQFDNGNKEWLTDVLQQRLQKQKGAGVAPYLASLGTGGGEAELRVLATLLTVTETYFFRVGDQFRALADAVLADRTRAHVTDHRLRFLSAGCASGEEAYSIAILLLERFPELRSWEIEVLGLDLNSAMIAKAREGRYHKWSLRDTAEEVREKYFRREGADYVLEPAARPMVRFEEKNLVSTDWAQLGRFDVIFCRNVIMYLVPEAIQNVIAGLTQALAPGGFLFLGHAETLRGLSQDFHLRHTHEAFYYQKREAEEQTRVADAIGRGPEAPACELLDTAWMDAVRQASERIGRLSCDSAVSKEPVRPAGRPSQAELALIFELFRQERFRDALNALGGAAAEKDHDPDIQLLRAGLLTNCGDIEAAEAVCREILSGDDLNAGAHYLTALCRERAGDAQGAIEHDEAAIYLDGAFAMPHLHLGRMARRLADLTTARRELERAHNLLAREDAGRILLFGGGFNREALVAVSRAELRACRGSR